MEFVSKLIVPLIVFLVGLVICVSKRDLFSSFIHGAQEGAGSAIKLLPTLVALLCGIAMFNSSGASVFLSDMLTPIVSKIGIPSEIVPLILVRPLSGGASTAMISDILQKYGPDSFAGRCASVIAGSSDTLLYVVSVYFGAIGVKKTRGTLPIAFLTMVFCVFFSCFLCRIVFKI